MTLRDGGRETEHRVLERLKEWIALSGDTAELYEAEARGETIEILGAMFTRFGEHLDTIPGEFLFRDVPGDPDGARYFCTVLTLKDEILLDQVPELSYGISILNFYIESGCFALNSTADRLVFRSTRIFSGSAAEEDIPGECVMEAEQALDTLRTYNTAVQCLAEGSLPLEGFMELFG